MADEILIEYFCEENFRTISQSILLCRQGCSSGQCNTQVVDPSDVPENSVIVLENLQLVEDAETLDEPGFFTQMWQFIVSVFKNLF